MASILNEVLKATKEDDIIKMLGREDAHLNEIGPDGHSALHTAINYRCFKLALEMVMDPRTNVNTFTVWGSSPLSCALHHRQWNLAKVMLCSRPEINVNTRNMHRFTPLHQACEFGAHEIVKLILQRPDAQVNTCDDAGISPLIEACMKWPKYGDETVKALIARHDLDPNFSSMEGITAFMIAASKQEGIKLFELLLCSRKSTVKFDTVSTLFIKPNDIVNLASLTPFDKQGPRLRIKYGFAQKEATDLFMLILSDGKVKKGKRKFAKFLRLARRFPPEIQMRMCNLAYAINKDFVKLD